MLLVKKQSFELSSSARLVKAADGNLYYVQAQGRIVKDKVFYVQTPNGYVARGYYAFDANGALIG